MKKINDIHRLLKNPDYTKKIRLYFSVRVVPDNFDPYEKNYDYTLLNPITVRGLVQMLSPEALVWKSYGLTAIGSVQIITELKYLTWFENCNKVEIDSNTYTVYRESTGSRAIMQERPNNILRVVLERK